MKIGLWDFFVHGEVNDSSKWKGRVAGTTVGVIGGAIAGNIGKDLFTIGDDPRIVSYGAIGLGGLLGFLYLSDWFAAVAQVTSISGS